MRTVAVGGWDIEISRMDDSEVGQIVLAASDNSDSAKRLARVLALLVAANLQEGDEDDSDENYDAQMIAESELFRLATALTKGHRWPVETKEGT